MLSNLRVNTYPPALDPYLFTLPVSNKAGESNPYPDHAVGGFNHQLCERPHFQVQRPELSSLVTYLWCERKDLHLQSNVSLSCHRSVFGFSRAPKPIDLVALDTLTSFAAGGFALCLLSA